MSWSLNLLIDGPASLDALARELNLLLVIALGQEERHEGTKAAYSNNEFTDNREYFFLSLVDEHGLENDRDMNFEDFAYELNITRKNSCDPNMAEQKCFEFARLAFDTLKKTGKYRLMLTENVQSKLDSFDPLYL